MLLVVGVQQTLLVSGAVKVAIRVDLVGSDNIGGLGCSAVATGILVSPLFWRCMILYVA